MKHNPDERLAWALGRCRESGMRRTQALIDTLRELIARDAPATLSELAESPALRDRCDKATVYRLLMRLEGNGLVRRLGLHERAAYFTIKYPGHHSDYLVCTQCGSIDTLDISCPVEALEKDVSQRSGFKELYHELEFYGVCPQCD